MSELIIAASRRRARRNKVTGIVALLLVLVLAALLAVRLARRTDPNTPHGNPDPGGRRLAFLEQTAHRVTPPSATNARMTIHPYAWDEGGCDGGAAGWAPAEVNLFYRSAGPARVDAAMQRLHWRRLAIQGGDAVREYQPAPPDPYVAFAVLFAVRGGWELDLSADPAEVRTHSC